MSHEKKRTPGERWEPPRADEINSWNETAEFWELKKRLGEKIKDERMPVPTEMDAIKVRNQTGGPREESDVVQISGSPLAEDKVTRLHPWMDAVQPGSRCDRIAVLRYATAEGAIRWAQVSGPTFAKVDLTDGRSRCSPRAGLFHFVGDDDGSIEILWAPTFDPEDPIKECIVEMEQVTPPGTYIAKVPDGLEIPGRDGLYPGSFDCEIYRLDPHSYEGSESKSIVPIRLPDNSILTKTIYNLSTQVVKPGYHAVHRDECGNWMIEAGLGLVLLSPKNDCFKSWITAPQEMYLWKFSAGDWVITSEVVHAFDKTDANFLIKGEPQWAQVRPQVDSTGIPEYDLIGSYGLYRMAKANGQIDCEQYGSAQVYSKVESSEAVCGTADWHYDSAATPQWTVTRDGCGEGCEPEQPQVVSIPNVFDIEDVPCKQSTSGSSEPEDCQINPTECTIDKVCNTWGDVYCVESGQEGRIRYHPGSNGVWHWLPFERNGSFTAELSADLCPTDGTASVTNVEPLDFCMDQDDKDAITSAANSFGLSGESGDLVYLKRDRTQCGGTIHIVNVKHKCMDILADDCGGTDHITITGCGMFASVWKKTSQMSCNSAPDSDSQHTFPTQTIVESATKTDTTPSSGQAQNPYATCKIDLVTRDVCVVWKSGSTGTIPLLAGEYGEFISLADLNDSGLCFTYTEGWFLCLGGDDTDCITTTDCPTASGSG